MIKDLRNTFKQTAIYGISNVLIKATGLILLPIYTTSLSVTDMGILVTFEIIMQFLVGVISFNIPVALLRFGSDTESVMNQRQIYATAGLLLFGVVAVFLAVSLPFTSYWSQLFFDSDDYSLVFTVMLGSVALEILNLLPLQLLRLREESTKYLGFFFVKLVGMLGFVAYFMLYRKMGVYGAVFGIFMGNVSLFISTIPFQIRQFTRHFDRASALEMYRYGAPLVFTTISAILLNISDRFIIKLYGDYADVGIYGTAYKIGSVSNLLVIGSFTMGFLPIAFKKFKEPGFERFFSKVLTYFIALTVGITLLISLFSKEMIKIISPNEPDYWIAIILVPFIAYAFIFKALQYYISYSFMLTKRTKYHAWVTVIGVVANVILNFALIPKYNMYGAIAATGLSYILMCFVTHRFAQAHLPVKYEFGRIFILMGMCAVFIAAGMYINDLDIVMRLTIKFLLCILFVAGLYFVVADKSEKGKLGKLIALAKSENGWRKVMQELGN